jgi:phosphoglycolate phosphatase-like HAD superfamily hydrolase
MRVNGVEAKGVIFDLQNTLMGGVMHEGVRVLLARPGLVEGLQLLKDTDINCGIVTSSNELTVLKILRSLAVNEFFKSDDVLGGDSMRSRLVPKEMTRAAKGWRGVLGAREVHTVLLPQLYHVTSKPSPAGVQYLLEKWGLQPESAVFIGDDLLVDGTTAKSAGVAFRQIPYMTGMSDDVSLYDFLQDIE